MKTLRRWQDRSFGRGSAVIPAPVFDGALKPNQLLQEAEVCCSLEQPEDLATDGRSLYLADGSTVIRVSDDGVRERVLDVGRPITGLACVQGGFAVALEGSEVRVMGGHFDGRRFTEVNGRRLHAANALVTDGDRLIVTDGSALRPYTQWRHDLMESNRAGRVCALDLSTGGSSQIADGLGYAFGAAAFKGSLLVSESWRHRLSVVLASGEVQEVIGQLPGYPSRLTPASGGGYWMTVFCCRTQLVEFVLREPAYRQRMIDTVDPDLWISPQLSTWRSFHEPLQYAGLKQVGVVKPWAPPRSYGLVVRLDANGLPRYSFHSRAGGTFHGIVAAVEVGRYLYMLSKGAKLLLRLEVEKAEMKVTP